MFHELHDSRLQVLSMGRLRRPETDVHLVRVEAQVGVDDLEAAL